MATKGPKFLLATLATGMTVLSEFSNLSGSGQGYSGQVFSGRKPFNAWRVVGTTHPVTGEPVLVRTREMYNGSQIVKVEQVRPKAGMETSHGYNPENFEPVPEFQKGQYGMFVGPVENTPEGVVAGVEYPIHRDPDSLRRYIILSVARGDTPEQRHYLDGAGAGAGAGNDAETSHVRDEDTGGFGGFGPSDADDDEGGW